MKLILHPLYQDQQTEIRQLVAGFFGQGELVVKGARNTIKANTLGTEQLSIKFFRKPGWIKSFVYSFFKASKAQRSFEYAQHLLSKGIATPFPVAYAEERNVLGLLGKSYYLCHQIDYDFTIRELIHDPQFPDRVAILEQFTEFTFRMHQAGIHFLDHSPGNTLIVKKTTGGYDFYLVDLNRMRFESLSIEQRMENFKKMWLSRQMIKTVARRYAELSNEPEEKLHQLLQESAARFKRKINRKKYLKRKIGRKA